MNITEEECACEAVLSFEDATYNGQALQLVFRYGDQTFAPDSANEMKKIIYRKTSGEIGFFRRNITVEEQAVQLLTNAGLQQLNATHFQLSAKAPEKTIVEWINNHREMLQQSFHLTSNVGNALYCLDEIPSSKAAMMRLIGSNCASLLLSVICAFLSHVPQTYPRRKAGISAT